MVVRTKERGGGGAGGCRRNGRDMRPCLRKIICRPEGLGSPEMPEHQRCGAKREITEIKRVANHSSIRRTLVSGCNY